MINVEGIVLPNKPLTNFQLIDAAKNNTHNFTNLAEPTLPSDSAIKNYVDTHSSGGTSVITSDLNLNSHKLINVSNPTNAQDAATKN